MKLQIIAHLYKQLMPKLWESQVLRTFRMVPKNPSRSEFHGAYTKFMCSFFPGDDYIVFPRFKPGPDPSPYWRVGVTPSNTGSGKTEQKSSLSRETRGC